jgi:hypothetical protein
MVDIYKDTFGSPLSLGRIQHLLSRMQENISLGSYQTQQELNRAFADSLSRLIKGNEKAIYNLPCPQPGAPVNQDDLNEALLGIYSEIEYLFVVIKSFSTSVTSNFNFAIANIRDLQSRLKRIKQQLSVYSLYTQRFGNLKYLGDTFLNEENIDRGSPFLSTKECFIDTTEGTISLPRIEGVSSYPIKKIEIGSNSNGVLGNNVEAKTPVRGALKSLYDGNVDTWTEYERVVRSEDDMGLQWELKITLEDVKAVNSIKIHPVFLGGRTPPVIDDLSISADGKEWISLYSEIRVATFLGEKEEDRFHLAPHSSKFSGEFNATFAPRQVKFIQLKIRQNSTYPIMDTYGTQFFRYAIGIKELSVFGYKYESLGEMISKNVNIGSFSAAGIESLVDPPFIPPELGSVEYFLSFNDGVSWQQLTTLEESSLDTPEILFPETEVSSLRWKVKLSKNEDAFDQIVRDVTPVSTREVFPWSELIPYRVNLSHKPIDGTITVCDPNIATRGKVYPKFAIGKGVYSTLILNHSGDWERHGNTQLRLKIPILKIKEPSDILVYVNNITCSKIASWSGVGKNERSYMVARNTDNATNEKFFEIIFGNDSEEDPRGFIPSMTDTISIALVEEEIGLEGLAPPYNVKLDYSSSGRKKDFEIRFRGSGLKRKSIQIPSGSTKIDLEQSGIYVNDGDSCFIVITARTREGVWSGAAISQYGVTGILSSAFETYQEFIDGNSENDSPGFWSVDVKEGIIYTHDEVDDTSNYSASFWYEESVYLTEDDWDFADGKLDELVVYSTGYYTAEGTQAFSLGQTSVDLTDAAGIVSKSIRITNGFASSVAPFEVPYINGKDEFKVAARLQDEEVPTSTATGSTPIAAFQLTHSVDLAPEGGFFFTEDGGESTVFLNEVANYGSLSSLGDYYVDVDGGYVYGKGYVYVVLAVAGATIPANTTVGYYYNDAFAVANMSGAFSVDAKKGRVFFQSQSTTSGTIYYKHTPYSIKYNIAAKLEDETEWKLGDDGKSISIKVGASETLGRNLSVQYQYAPDVVSAVDLAPYYSPLLRAFVVRLAS